MKEAIVFILLVLVAKTNAAEIEATARIVDDDRVEITVIYTGKSMIFLQNPNYYQINYDMLYASDSKRYVVAPKIEVREPPWKHLIVLVEGRESPSIYRFFKWVVSLDDRPYLSDRPSDPPDRVRLDLMVAAEKDFKVKTIAAFKSVSVEAVIQKDQKDHLNGHSLNREPGDSNGLPSGSGESPDNSRSAPRQQRGSQPPAEPGSAPK